MTTTAWILEPQRSFIILTSSFLIKKFLAKHNVTILEHPLFFVLLISLDFSTLRRLKVYSERTTICKLWWSHYESIERHVFPWIHQTLYKHSKNCNCLRELLRWEYRVAINSFQHFKWLSQINYYCYSYMVCGKWKTNSSLLERCATFSFAEHTITAHIYLDMMELYMTSRLHDLQSMMIF